METKNHPIEKKSHLNQTSMFGFKMWMFQLINKRDSFHPFEPCRFWASMGILHHSFQPEDITLSIVGKQRETEKSCFFFWAGFVRVNMFFYIWQIFGWPSTFSLCNFCGFSFGFHSNSLQVKPLARDPSFAYSIYIYVCHGFNDCFVFYPAKLGKCSNFIHTCFQMGWNHHVVSYAIIIA